MCDLLWSDPQPQVSTFMDLDAQSDSNFTCKDTACVCLLFLTVSFASLPSQNGRSVSKRGVSCQFGPDVTERFLDQNKLDYIVRSHEVKGEGYEITHSGKCITVFSAPNYW